MIKKIFFRNFILFAICALLLSLSVGWSECFLKRGKYLLGIVYNGNFKNEKDIIVYESYIKRHGSTPTIFQQNL